MPARRQANLLDARAIDAFDQHLDGAVGELEHLQDGRHGAEAVQVLELRIIDVGLLLRHQHDALVGPHGRIERLDRLLAAHEQRDHHVRIDHDVAQRQHGYGWTGTSEVDSASWFTGYPLLNRPARVRGGRGDSDATWGRAAANSTAARAATDR